MDRWWSRRDRPRRAWRRRALAALGACALAAPLGGARCTAELRFGTGVFADGERDPRDAALAGSWRRVELDPAGESRVIETVWTFASAGDVAHTVVARNLSGALIDAGTRRGRWRTEGGVVVIEFTAPASGRQIFTWRVERLDGGDRLLLDGVAYDRVRA